MAKKLSEGRKPGSGLSPNSNEGGKAKPAEKVAKRWDDAMIGIPEPGAMLSIEDTAAIINSIPEERRCSG